MRVMSGVSMWAAVIAAVTVNGCSCGAPEQIVADSKADDGVVQKAKANAFPDFLLGVKEKLLTLLIQRRDRNEQIRLSRRAHLRGRPRLIEGAVV